MTTEAQSKYCRVTQLYFKPLAPDGTNFLDWHFNIRSYLSAEAMIYTLKPNLEKEIESALKWQTLLVLRRHLDPSLRMQYIHEEDPTILWTALESRFQHEETIILPQARSDWLNLESLTSRVFIVMIQNCTVLSLPNSASVTRASSMPI